MKNENHNDNTTLAAALSVGTKIKIGKQYANEIGGFSEGEIIELIQGYFEYENGLYTETITTPAIWCEKQKDFDSIYHLFGNDLEDFMDCQVISDRTNKK